MSQESELNRRMQMSLIEMNDKLDKVLSAIGAMETKVHALEQRMEERRSLSPKAPSLPPKPFKHDGEWRKGGGESNLTKSPVYEEVEKAPVLPYRKRGKVFSKNQLEYMRSELGEVKQYVNITKTKDENEKYKIIGSLNCLIGTLQPSPGST